MYEILVVFDSQDGQTEKIAKAMAETIRCLGCNADAVHVENLPRLFSSSAYDGLILGGPIHAGRHSKKLSAFVRRYLPQLNAVPAAFFSVSLSAAGTGRQRDDAKKCLKRFLDDTGFRPIQAEIIAGAVKYRSYGFVKRLLMKWIVRRAGGPTDVSHNYEYTNWTSVSQFVERFLEAAGIDAFAAR